MKIEGLSSSIPIAVWFLLVSPPLALEQSFPSLADLHYCLETRGEMGFSRGY